MSGSPPSPPAPRAQPALIPAELVPERSGTVAFFSSINREGDWILPRIFRVFALMGNAELDLTRARIGPGTSEIELKAVMGNIEILVPPDLRLECEVSPVMGSLEVKRDAPSLASSDAPLVRITGTAFLASVEIKVVDPNAPGFLEKLRARWDAAGRPPASRA